MTPPPPSRVGSVELMSMGIRFLPSTLRPSVLLTLNGSFDGLFIIHLVSERRGSGPAGVHGKRHLATT